MPLLSSIKYMRIKATDSVEGTWYSSKGHPLVKFLMHFQVKYTPGKWRQSGSYICLLKLNFHKVSKYLFAPDMSILEGYKRDCETKDILEQFLNVFKNFQSPWILRVDEMPLLT